MLSEMQYRPRNSDLPKKCYFETVTGCLKKVISNDQVPLSLVSIRIIWQPLPFLGGTQVKPGVLLSAITPLWKHVLVKAWTSDPYPRVGRETSFKLEMLCATWCLPVAPSLLATPAPHSSWTKCFDCTSCCSSVGVTIQSHIWSYCWNTVLSLLKMGPILIQTMALEKDCSEHVCM